LTRTVELPQCLQQSQYKQQHFLNAVAGNKKGACVKEKNSRNMERWPARPYRSSGADSGVVERACLTLHAAAAYGTPEVSNMVFRAPWNAEAV